MYKQGISLAVYAQKSNVQYDHTGPTNIIPHTLYRSQYNTLLVCYLCFCNGPIKMNKKDARDGSACLTLSLEKHDGKVGMDSRYMTSLRSLII